MQLCVLTDITFKGIIEHTVYSLTFEYYFFRSFFDFRFIMLQIKETDHLKFRYILKSVVEQFIFCHSLIFFCFRLLVGAIISR